MVVFDTKTAVCTRKSGAFHGKAEIPVALLVRVESHTNIDPKKLRGPDGSPATIPDPDSVPTIVQFSIFRLTVLLSPRAHTACTTWPAAPLSRIVTLPLSTTRPCLLRSIRRRSINARPSVLM